MAPASRHELGDDARATFRSVSRAAFDRRGLWGLLLVSTQEFADLAVTIVRERRDAYRENHPESMSFSPAPLVRDLRLATRAVWSARTTSLLAALTLALGIGSNAAVFSVLDSVLLRPVPFPGGDRLVEIWSFSLDQKMTFNAGVPPAAVAAWRQEADLFDRVEGFERRSLVFEDAQGAIELSGAVLTPGAFDLLGAVPIRGRGFLPHDEVVGARPVAVVSHTFWTAHLGQRTDLASISISLDGIRHDVIGVAPVTFRFPSGHERVWIAGLPTAVTPLARLRPGLAFAVASAEVTARGEAVGAAVGGPPGVSATLARPAEGVDARTETTLVVLGAAVAFLFLIVCVNVANLTLSRALGRTRDLATCGALGASRGSLFRVVFLEQSLLAIAGVILGTGVATLVLRVAVAALPDVMTTGTLNAIDLDARAWLVLVATDVGTMVVCGLPPAWLATRVSVASGIAHHGRATSGSPFARRLRLGLAVTEIAVSVALLIGAALITRSFVAMASASHGYTPQGLVSLRLGLPAAAYTDAAVAAGAMRDVARRIETLPGVAGVTIGGLPSESGLMAFGALEIDGRPGVVDPRAVVRIHEVDERYFDVLQLPIRAGRAFIAPEVAAAAIVNEQFATTHFGDEDPIGRRFRIGRGDWRTVVGVATNTLGDRERGSRRAELYYPLGQAEDAGRAVRRASSIAHFVTLLVRSENPAAIVPLLSGAVHDRDPAIVVRRTALVERMLADAIARPRVAFVTMLVFALFGLALSMVGLYGVLSHLVAQRRHEIGVRMALGARAADIRRLILGHGLALAAGGITLGFLAAWPMIRLMRSLLVDIADTDPAALTAPVLVVAVTALLASWVPARAAGRTSPVELFRGE
jgi:predicted permease